jgi:hypothetical protein
VLFQLTEGNKMDGIKMKTIASLEMGDAIGSPNRIIAVVVSPPRPGFGRTIDVPLATFPGGQPVELEDGTSAPVFLTRTYLNPGAMVAVRERAFPVEGLADAAAA